MAVSFYLLLSLPLPNSLRVLQWNAGSLQARSTKLIHFISSHSVDLIYIQDSNLNLSSSFQIPGFSALRSDRTHSRSGIFSTDVADASGGVIIFVKQSLFSSELSTSSLSSLGPYSDYVEVNISPNDSSSLLFLNAYAPLFVLLRRIAEPISFLFPFLPLCGSGSGGIFRASASASASTEKDRFHRFRFQLPLPLPHPCSIHNVTDENSFAYTCMLPQAKQAIPIKYFLEKITRNDQNTPANTDSALSTNTDQDLSAKTDSNSDANSQTIKAFMEVDEANGSLEDGL